MYILIGIIIGSIIMSLHDASKEQNVNKLTPGGAFSKDNIFNIKLLKSIIWYILGGISLMYVIIPFINYLFLLF